MYRALDDAGRADADYAEDAHVGRRASVRALVLRSRTRSRSRGGRARVAAARAVLDPVARELKLPRGRAEELDAVVGEVVGRLRREEHDARDATRVGGRRRVGETGEGCGSGGGRDRRVGATTRARWDATYRRADRSALALSDRSRLNDPSSLSPRPNPAGLGGRLIARGVRSAARWSVCWMRRRHDESLDLVA